LNADCKVRTCGSVYVQAQFPHVLGRDFSGVVSAVGDGVAGLGDAVFAVCDVGQEGAYAEKIAIRAEIVARKPASLGHVEAAALAVTGLTALIAIEDTLQLRAGWPPSLKPRCPSLPAACAVVCQPLPVYPDDQTISEIV
jgi:NADPH:quinone reductase-like Zn-dependent oxidoreductase